MRRFAWFLLLAPTCFGYISQVTADSQQTPLTRSDNTGIQFYLNSQIVPGVQSSASGSTVTVISSDSNPQQAIHAALATWGAVSTANVHFLPLKSTSSGIDPNDRQMTIAIASSTSDVSAVGGALAVTIDSYTVPGGVIVDSDIIVSASQKFSTTTAANTFDLQAVMTHELGHALGANHTGILGATMFQFNTPVQRQLSSDDLAFVNAVYPSSTSPVPFGSIAGKVTITGTPGAALLTIVDTQTGGTFGGVTANDGTFTVKVPVGTYQMYAEPLTGVVKPGNLYFTPQLTAGSLQSTMFSGTFTVTANSTTPANVTANNGPSLSVPFIAITSHNGPLPAQFPQGGPVFVPSGGQVDLLMYSASGTDIDASLGLGNFTIYGLGSGFKPDSVGQVLNLSPFTLRVTLTIPAQQSLSLASVFITKGTSTLTLSGALVIGPPTPVTTPASMVSAASLTGNGIVSPGGIYAFFDTPAGLNLGPATPLGNSGYDAYQFLPASLGGVSVTFDGVPAPLFFVWGNQINLQVPFEVANKKTTNVVVNYLGSASAAVPVSVNAAEPAIFTTCLQGGVQVACVVNQTADATGNFINGPTSPAARGTTVTVFGTGVGVLPSSGYSLQTGGSAPAPPISANGYTCTIGGVNAPVAFAGWTYSAVGLAQWNVQVPSSLGSTGKLALACTNGSQSTQTGVNVYVN